MNVFKERPVKLLIATGVAIFIGGLYLALVSPQYLFFKVQAALWNAENWKNGNALRVTVQVTSNPALGSQTAIAAVDCYEKTFATPKNIKGPAWKSVFLLMDGPRLLSVPFHSEATHQTELVGLCSLLLKSGGQREVPFSIEYGLGLDAFIVANDRSFKCYLGRDRGTTKGTVTHLEIVGVERISLRAKFNFISYASIERPYSPLKQSIPPDLRGLETLYWVRWDEASRQAADPPCWSKKPSSVDKCVLEAEAICGTPLR